MKRFKETTKNFLQANLNYIYEKGYIKMLLDEINILTNSIKESLKTKLKEEYIIEEEIKESINECFQGKFLKLKEVIEKALNINENNSKFNKNNTPYYNCIDYPENPESDNKFQRPNVETQENIYNRQTIEENNENNNDYYNYNFNNDNQEDMIQNNINNGNYDNNEENKSSPPYPNI